MSNRVATYRFNPAPSGEQITSPKNDWGGISIMVGCVTELVATLLLEQPATANRPTLARRNSGRGEREERATIGAGVCRPALSLWQAAPLFDSCAALACRSIVAF